MTLSLLKCRTCFNFDFCEACFYWITVHKHRFNRIRKPGGAAVLAGRPGWSRRVLSGGRDVFVVKSTVNSSPLNPSPLTRARLNIAPHQFLFLGCSDIQVCTLVKLDENVCTLPVYHQICSLWLIHRNQSEIIYHKNPNFFMEWLGITFTIRLIV